VVTENAVYTAQWEPEVFTVRFVDWDNTLIKEVQVPYGGSADVPANPTRTGYTFTGWSPAYNGIVSDLTVAAQYVQNSGSSSSSGSSGASSKPAVPAPHASSRPQVDVPVAPSETVAPFPTETPSDGGESLAVWALVNLILSIIGVILAVLMTICVLLQKKQKQKGEQKKTIKGPYVGECVEEQKQKKRLTLWLLVTVALGIAGIIVFLLTEDVSRTMALVDKWTIINVVIFAVEIIAIALHTRVQKSKNKQASKQKMMEAQK
jgi:uncharacterized repeat protein (TIGR02543 family)